MIKALHFCIGVHRDWVWRSDLDTICFLFFCIMGYISCVREET